MILVFLACTPEPGAASGTATNARDGSPAAGIPLVLSAAGDACPARSVTTDDAGRWSADGLCGGASWTVASGDPDWYVEPVPAARDLALVLTHAPSIDGVYFANGDVLVPLTTDTALDTVQVFGSDRSVRYPVEIPGSILRVSHRAALLVMGDVLAGSPRFEPLVPCGERRWFGTKEAPRAVDPWVYLGVRFRSDTDLEPVEATVDPARVEVSDVGGRPLTVVNADALPPGRYALSTPDGNRAFLFDFGDATTP